MIRGSVLFWHSEQNQTPSSKLLGAWCLPDHILRAPLSVCRFPDTRAELSTNRCVDFLEHDDLGQKSLGAWCFSCIMSRTKRYLLRGGFCDTTSLTKQYYVFLGPWAERRTTWCLLRHWHCKRNLKPLGAWCVSNCAEQIIIGCFLTWG